MMEPDEHVTGHHHPHHHHDEEEPPFALIDKNYPQHLFVSRRDEFLSPRPSSAGTPSPQQKTVILDSQLSTKSPPPGLAESMLSTPSDDGSCSTLGESGGETSPGYFGSPPQPGAVSQYMDASSTFLMSSLPTITSATGGGSSHLPHSRELLGHHPETVIGGGYPTNDRRNSVGDASRGSIGFSQLLQAADDKVETAPFGGKSVKMPVVPEEASHQTSLSWGTLISAGTDVDDEGEENQRLLDPNRTRREDCPIRPTWFNDFLTLGQTPICTTLCGPLAGRPSPSPSSLTSPLLSYEPPSTEVARAREGIKATLVDEDSFEVSVDVNSQITAQHVMEVLGNPELLRLWCDPIQALVVTRSSEGARDAANAHRISNNNNNVNSGSNNSNNKNGREYEGEWIEATTASLVSPHSHAGYIHGAVQAVMDGLGFSSYGKVTMFVERRRGQVGLTVGPFHGGIFASHTIAVHEEQGQSGGIRVRIVDRVRLTTEDEQELSLASMFLCGVLDSLNRCLLPSVGSYMEQVTKSLIHLRGLVETGRAYGRGDNWVVEESGIIIPGS